VTRSLFTERSYHALSEHARGPSVVDQAAFLRVTVERRASRLRVVVAVSCYQCGSRSTRPYAEENGFSLVKCRGCGLLYVNPRPSDEEVSEAARTGLHQGATAFERIGEFDERKIRTYLDVLGRLFRDRKDLGPRWLDIGCGHGEFLVALQRYAGLDQTLLGIEPSKPKRDSARSRGLNVVDETFRAEPAAFDGISLLNVYSHLPDPVSALKDWTAWLKPGGQLLLQTGDSCHLPARYHHKPFELPDHLSFSNERLVSQVLERVGLRVVRSVKLRHGAYPGWQFWKHPFRDMWLLAERH